MTTFTLEIEREDDGRWITEIPELPGVMSYGATRDEAIAKAEALALRVLADHLEHGEDVPALLQIGWTIKRQSGGSHRSADAGGMAERCFRVP
jgi:predicted RNase H-like HicB family nuclease